MKKLMFFCLFLMGLSSLMLAVPAIPTLITYRQPDNTEIQVYLQGDELMKYAQTPDGYSLLFNSQGVYEYAQKDGSNNIVPSGVKAHNLRDRTSVESQWLIDKPKGLQFSASQRKIVSSLKSLVASQAIPTTGIVYIPCILMGFKDLAFSKTKAEYEALFNQVNYSIDGAVGSVYDYYYETSYGKLQIQTTVVGPYTASQNLAYYGANDATTENDVNPTALISEAVTLANPDLNYATFDNDKDGYVDCVYVIHAGFGEEAGADANTIWSHAYAITPVRKDGKWVYSYSCSAELRGSSGDGIARIGPICHELGHTFGAHDFYDTNYATDGQQTGTGYWDIMGYGAWCNGGINPSHHNPYNKCYVYNWATPTLLSSNSQVSISEASKNAQFYRINTTTANEFFLLENRQQLNFDSALPYHGLIVYHVDENYMTQNVPYYNTTSHQGLYPVCASATDNPPTSYGSINNGGCPFPGTSNKTSFTNLTIPSSRSWANADTPFQLINITETNPNTSDALVVFNATNQLPTQMEQVSNRSYSISPLPASSFIEISGFTTDEELLFFQIVNSAGKIVMSKEVLLSSTLLHKIDVHAWPSGVYYLLFSSDRGYNAQKFVVLHNNE